MAKYSKCQGLEAPRPRCLDEAEYLFVDCHAGGEVTYDCSVVERLRHKREPVAMMTLGSGAIQSAYTI